MTGPDCAVMCNLINTHLLLVTKIFDPLSDRRTNAFFFSLAGPDCMIVFNLTNILKHKVNKTAPRKRRGERRILYCSVV